MKPKQEKHTEAQKGSKVILTSFIFLLLLCLLSHLASGGDFVNVNIGPETTFEYEIEAKTGDSLKTDLWVRYSYSDWTSSEPVLEWFWRAPSGEMKDMTGIGGVSGGGSGSGSGNHTENGGLIFNEDGVWTFTFKNNHFRDSVLLGYNFELKKDDLENVVSSSYPAIIGAVLLSSFGICAYIIGTREPIKYSLFASFSPLYTKIKKDKVLLSFIRGQIYQVINDNPGIYYSAIKSKLKLKNGALAHHLRILEEQGFIKTAKDGQYKRFFHIDYNVSKAPLHMSDVQKRIVGILTRCPGINQIEISKSLGLSPEVVGYNIGRLEKKGIIEIRYIGREVHHYLKGGFTHVNQ